MTPDDFIDGTFQDLDIHRAADAEVKVIVIVRAGFELVQEPDALLGKVRGDACFESVARVIASCSTAPVSLPTPCKSKIAFASDSTVGNSNARRKGNSRFKIRANGQ